MKRFQILLSAGLALSLGACSLNEPVLEPESSDAPKMSLSSDINQIYQTRANDTGFCNGDVIGIYVVDYELDAPGVLKSSGNRADNVRHTYSEADGRWIPAYDIYYKDRKTPVDIYGYYPVAGVENVEAFAFEIQKDQSTSATENSLGGYEVSDFLWGKASKVIPTNRVVNVSMGHIMSTIRVSLVEGTGFESDEWVSTDKSLTILGTKVKTEVNMATGKVSLAADNAVKSIIPYEYQGDYRAIVAPQTIDAGSKLLGITIGGMPYNFSKAEAIVFESGRQNNFTITVNKKIGSGYELVLTDESITPWENDAVGHDAIAKEYVVVNVEEPGTLAECIRKMNKNPRKLKNLKLTGQINRNDFYFMRDSMAYLQALNMKEVIIKARAEGYDPNEEGDYMIPERAFQEKKSLVSIVLPDELVYIHAYAFHECTSLSGSLIIPEGVIQIEAAAFEGCRSLNGTLTLPSTLEIIGGDWKGGGYGGTFQSCNFTCELKLPAKLRKIGHDAFHDCRGLYGTLELPESLEIIEKEAFCNIVNFSGSLKLPQSISVVETNAFSGCGFNGNLTLHDGIISIEDGAFAGCHFKGELNLPKNLVVIGDDVFNGCDFSGNLKLPAGLTRIGNKAFAYNWRLTGVLELPDGVSSIGAGAFAKCRSLEGVVFNKDLEVIKYEPAFYEDGGAFQDCFGIGRIVCKGTIPPYVQEGAFNGVPKDNFTLEVPEEAIQLYQTEVGWKDFKRIAAYRNLVIRPMVATAINTSVSRNLVLNADEDWIVESKPDWVALDRMSGTGKTELVLTFSQMPAGENREGEVVFKLKDKDYRTRCKVTQYDYEYAEDEIITLQTASKGNGVNIVFLGDGYNAKDISDGLLLSDMKQSVEHYFSIEPYKTYRDYFNVYTAIPVSAESGVGTINTIIENRFGTTFKGGVNVSATDQDYTGIFEYACKAPTVTKDNINRSLVVMIPNTEDYGGICYMWDDGSAIAYCPKSDYGYPLDWRGTIQHEAGGHGFAKLGDEYIYHNAFIDNCSCTCCPHDGVLRANQALGWYQNLSLSGKFDEVPWSHLIFHEKYSGIVDIFEGGFMHNRGVYRSEQNSCMNNDIPYYNTISRQEMVERILTYAGEEFTFEKFVANDVIDATVAVETKAPYAGITRPAMYRSAPVRMGSKPDLN